MIKLYAKIWNLLSTQETILSETMNHYKTLYSEKQVEDVCLNEDFFLTFAIKKLSNTEQQQIEGNLTYEEMLNSLKRMRNDSSPGNSGFTPAFYTFFLDRSWSFLSKICYWIFC